LVILNEIWHCHIFGKPKKQKINLVQNAVPSPHSTKKKWAHGIFEEWQRQRLVEVPIVEVVGLFKNYDFHQVKLLATPMVEMSGMSLNYWKFGQEVAKPSKECEFMC